MPKSYWINYTTFKRDLEWLDYSLQTFVKYGSDFDGVVICVPMEDVEAFMYLEKKFSTQRCAVWIRGYMEYPDKGFVHHLAMKTYADVFIPDATHILHMDPDCMWKAPVTPYDYLVDDKPVMLIEPYEAFKTLHPPRYGWKAVTEHALQFDCPYETMCRHPAIHLKETYKGLRDYIEKIHRDPFIDFVLKLKNSHPQGYGEFNTLGSWVLKFCPEKYHLIDRGTRREELDPPAKVLQLWSYTGVRKNIDDIKKILA